LVISNVAALPMAAQDALAVALSERTPAGGASAFMLVASVPRPLGELVDAGHVARALGRLLLPGAVSVPALVERPEDLRGLVLDTLCKSGVRFDGQTLGIEPRALGALVDHAWPGNQRELQSVLERAARAASGERVRLADLEEAGFVASDAGAAPAPGGAFADPARAAPASLSPPMRRPSTSLVVARRRSDALDLDERDADAGEPLGGEPGASARGGRRRRRR
ncbi:MAG TPA: hypothetical protein VMG12_02010, partial [Polyangiaceae bacterium]|nr:hypothetical protein [Polyangiaceae bacterium]